MRGDITFSAPLQQTMIERINHARFWANYYSSVAKLQTVTQEVRDYASQQVKYWNAKTEELVKELKEQAKAA